MLTKVLATNDDTIMFTRGVLLYRRISIHQASRHIYCPVTLRMIKIQQTFIHNNTCTFI